MEKPLTKKYLGGILSCPIGLRIWDIFFFVLCHSLDGKKLKEIQMRLRRLLENPKDINGANLEQLYREFFGDAKFDDTTILQQNEKLESELHHLKKQNEEIKKLLQGEKKKIFFLKMKTSFLNARIS